MTKPEAQDVWIGWYGKLPSGGDFVHRGLGREQIQWWDRWLQRGVAGLGRGLRKREILYSKAPFWNFLIPAGLGTGVVQLGCVGPSQDRVGRSYPLILICSISPDRYPADARAELSAFYVGLGRAMQGALRHRYSSEQLDQAVSSSTAGLVSQVQSQLTTGAKDDRLTAPVARQEADDILSILNDGHEAAPLRTVGEPPDWQTFAALFNAHSVSSFWWTNTAEGAAHQTHVHAGALNATLFDKLFVDHGTRSRNFGDHHEF